MRQLALQTTADELAKQLEPHTKAAEALFGNIRAMEAKVAEGLSKKETLKARAASAQVWQFPPFEITSLGCQQQAFQASSETFRGVTSNYPLLSHVHKS